MKESTMYYALRKPSYGRRKFRISVRENKKWRTLNLEEIDRINDLFLSGKISFNECEKEAKKILEKLYEARNASKSSPLSCNERLMMEYFASKYMKKSRQRRIADSTHETAFNDLKRAIVAVGGNDIRYASVDHLQEAIDSYYEDYESIGPHKKTIIRINALLKFAGRSDSDRLETLPEEYSEVKNLSHEEFLKVISELQGHDRILSTIAYYSGLRLGEIFALNSKKVRRTIGGYIINVDRQMYRNGEFGLPKRRKVRRSFAFDACKDELSKWLDTSETTRVNVRGRKYWEVVAQACSYAKVSNVLSFKDWRHCYAISLLNMGATISQVAQNLGNSEQVCRKYYTGYIMTNDGIETMARSIVKNAEEFFGPNG